MRSRSQSKKGVQMGNNFSLLWGKILDSSLWVLESKETRLVWVTMLAMKDVDGVVHASIVGLADRAKVTLEECQAALKVLESPDKNDTSGVENGVRIRKIPGGWQIVNNDLYRFSTEAKREVWRAMKAEQRAKEESRKTAGNNGHKKDETDQGKSKPKKIPTDTPEFQKFWEAYPKKVGRIAALKSFVKVDGCTHLPEILKALEWQRDQEQWTKDGGQFIPHPATWLNQLRWQDINPNQKAPEVAAPQPVRKLPDVFKAEGRTWDVRHKPERKHFITESSFITFSKLYSDWRYDYLAANPALAKQIEQEEVDAALKGAVPA